MSTRRRQPPSPRHLTLLLCALGGLLVAGCHPFESTDQYPLEDDATGDATSGDGTVTPADTDEVDTSVPQDTTTPPEDGSGETMVGDTSTTVDTEPTDVGPTDTGLVDGEPGDVVMTDATEVADTAPTDVVVCEDEDGDGVTTCQGDCDDSDPWTRPGAAEICGDGIDNACGEDPDPTSLCQGLGTYVSALTGTAGASGTKDDPVLKIEEALTNADIILSNSAGTNQSIIVYVGEGTYTDEVVLDTPGVSLFGGYECKTPGACSWQRAPAQFVSILEASDAEGLYVADNIGRTTKISGLQIRGATTDGAGQGQIVAAMTIERGTPILENNHIVGASIFNDCGWCTATGIAAFGPPPPSGESILLRRNLIEGGANDFSATSGMTLRPFGEGPAVELRDNELVGGTGSWTRALDVFNAGPGSIVEDNDLIAGSTGPHSGTSFALIISAPITISKNRINVDQGRVGSCDDGAVNTPLAWCGGIESEGATATLTNNVVLGMEAPRSVALLLSEGEVPFGEIVINANALDGGPGTQTSAAMACRRTFGQNAQVGWIRNNILRSGSAPTRASFVEDPLQGPGYTCEPHAFDNNDLVVDNSGASSGVAYAGWSGSVPSTAPDADAVNGFGFASENFDDDPLFVDWPTDPHIQTGSPCIDAGTDEEAPADDIDGDPRPLVADTDVDVGVDEAE